MSGENNCVLSNTVEWFNIAKPEPTEIDIQTQLGCHFEEVKELVDQIQGTDSKTVMLLVDAYAAMEALATHFKDSPFMVMTLKDPIEYLDALGDQIVTATGCATFAGMNMVGGLNEINRSNHSKFVDGKAFLKPNGKIGKGPDYTEPDLTPYI